MDRKKRAILIILDGFGIGKDSPFNAIQHAKMPFYKTLYKHFPFTKLLTCGEAVGLPEGVMGNSEVGHMNMGAGRILYQDLTRIQKSLRTGEFEKNAEMQKTLQTVEKAKGTLHLLTLLSDAGVHSDWKHLQAVVKMAYRHVPIVIHAFMDGRDTPPRSGLAYLQQLQDFLKSFPGVRLGSIHGRYYAMDRDERWDRTEKTYRVLVGAAEPDSIASGSGCSEAITALKKSYDAGITDEFVEPAAFSTPKHDAFIKDRDGVFFCNFRADRARQLTRALTESNWTFFKRDPFPKLSAFLCMTQYDATFPLPVAFPPQPMKGIFPEILEAQGLKQFRIAETEKYAHVTFFFNGGRETPYRGEDRLLIPSPRDVATYDLKPEMNAREVARQTKLAIEKEMYDFILLNFANPDMVGHTGNYSAAVQALVAIDECLKIVIETAIRHHYDVLLTADHGNIEEMCDSEGHPHTQHTLNPVPLHWITEEKGLQLRSHGILANLAPTLLNILNLSQPNLMTEGSLIVKK